MSFLTYFRSKRGLMAVAQDAKLRCINSWQENEKLRTELEKTAHKAMHYEREVDRLRAALAEVEKYRAEEGRLAALEKDVILRTVVGLGPMILAEAARAKSI